LVLLLPVLLGSVAPAQTAGSSTTGPQPGIIPPGPSARDGFTRSGTDILYTRHGITAKVSTPITLPNGVRVGPDGTINYPDGTRAALRANEILTLDGRVSQAALSPSGTAPVSPVGPGAPKAALITAPTDGITLAGNQAMVTRNGVTAKLNAELKFENGLRVRPNGSMILPNGTETSLKPNQMVTFRGQVVEAPALPR
jgi:hypothetical protein